MSRRIAIATVSSACVSHSSAVTPATAPSTTSSIERGRLARLPSAEGFQTGKRSEWGPRPRRTITAVAVLALVVAGCGSSKPVHAAATATKTPGPISTQQVIDTFRQQTGQHLIRSSKLSDDNWSVLSRDYAQDGRAADTWGTFSVYVVAHGDTHLLTEDDDGHHIRPDAQGVYWKKAPDEYLWVALKRYGANVLLLWIGEHRKSETLNASFDRVDTALRALEP